MTNPWNLTGDDQKLLSLLVAHGNDKRVASLLGISTQAIKCRLMRIRGKMDVPNRVVLAVAWDRWVMGRDEAVDNSEEVRRAN